MTQITKNYCYTFIRTDLPIEQQIVQAAHSAMESGREFYNPNTPTHLILLEAKSEDQLKNIAQYLEQRNIKFSLFYEPDWDRGYTSLTTEPLTSDEDRKHFKKFSLYKFKPQTAFGYSEERTRYEARV